MRISLESRNDKRIHILVVDDEGLLIRMWQISLERRGYKVSPFTDCFEALMAFKKSPAAFDIAITDQSMPGMTGVAFASELLKIRKSMPIILCTGYSDLDSRKLANSIGIREFITKPFDINQLEKVMKNLLSTEY